MQRSKNHINNPFTGDRRSSIHILAIFNVAEDYFQTSLQIFIVLLSQLFSHEKDHSFCLSYHRLQPVNLRAAQHSDHGIRQQKRVTHRNGSR